ncbi:MAG: hypothetical protein RSD80_01890, partial [Raoultibacter sp.]
MKYITRGDTVGQKSGIDTLIDVLRQSGMPVDVGGFSGSAEDVDPVASSSDGAGGKGSSSVPPKVNIEVPFSDKIASWGKRALIIALIVALIVAAV